MGVIAEAVLLVAAAGHDLAGALIGDDEGEDGEEEEEEDEDKHDEEVDPEEEGVAAAGADETGEGDDHQEGAQHDQGCLQELLAVSSAAAGGQPYPAAQDGHRE